MWKGGGVRGVRWRGWGARERGSESERKVEGGEQGPRLRKSQPPPSPSSSSAADSAAARPRRPPAPARRAGRLVAPPAGAAGAAPPARASAARRGAAACAAFAASGAMHELLLAYLRGGCSGAWLVFFALQVWGAGRPPRRARARRRGHPSPLAGRRRGLALPGDRDPFTLPPFPALPSPVPPPLLLFRAAAWAWWGGGLGQRIRSRPGPRPDRDERAGVWGGKLPPPC